MKMSDPFFSFEDQRRDAAIRQQVREYRDDIRRRRVTGRDPREKASAPWPVKEATAKDMPPAWTFERAADGRILKAYQNHPEKTHDKEQAQGSRFIVEILAPVFVGGQSLEPGAMVDCFRSPALQLHGTGRGRIVEEHAPPTA